MEARRKAGEAARRADSHGTVEEAERARQAALERLRREPCEDSLWQAVVAFQSNTFRTYSGLPFSYQLKKGRDGQFTRELFIDRRENSKSLAWSSVCLAFSGIREPGAVVTRPKALGGHSRHHLHLRHLLPLRAHRRATAGEGADGGPGNGAAELS